MLPLISLFPSIHDLETVVLLLLFIVFFWVGFSYLVTMGWIFEISLCENLSVVLKRSETSVIVITCHPIKSSRAVITWM